MLKGFRDFLLRGNLIELAVAFIMGGVFAAVVTTFTALIVDVLGLVLHVPNFSKTTVGGINVGPFLTAVVGFLLTGLVVYFFIVVPYNKLASLRKKDEPEAAASSEDLLAEIRDLLKEQNGGTATSGGTIGGGEPTVGPDAR